MSALEAASAGVKDMSDGSLRITIEFEPRYAKEAFALFGARGTPLAIAALKVGYAQKVDTSPERVQETPENEHVEKPKIGPLAYWLVLRCGEPEFWAWLENIGYMCGSSKDAGQIVKDLLGLQSRKDLDGNPDCVEMFHQHIRGPYARWCAARGVPA